MKRSTDSLIAVQFLAVVVPIAFVLLAQMMADVRRAGALAQSRPLRTLANDIRASYRTFTNGAADAVDTGTLGHQSAEALQTSARLLQQLAERGEAVAIGDAPRLAGELAAQVHSGDTLNKLILLRQQIADLDRQTRQIDEFFEHRDAAVARDASESAIRQKHQVIVALLISLLLTVIFVLAARIRLRRQLDAEADIERARRAELERLSIRFGMATRAARAGVYEIQQQSKSVWWSDMMNELYGQSAESFRPTLGSWLELIHPQDRAAAEEGINLALRERKALRTQYRILRPDGTIGHVESLAAVTTDSADSQPRLVGIDLDIAERVAAQEREQILQQRVREASRHAGMAEVATSVLHNVGNVLNSVNVSADIVVGNLRSNRLSGLQRVVSLMQEHPDDLGRFIDADPRGRHLPVYLAELSRQLSTDQEKTLNEIESLKKNIAHIKEIVAMQQRYAKIGVGGVTETLDLTNLVDESLRINLSALEGRAITVVREFERVPLITVDKHKVLQILVNLVRNAKDACEAAGGVMKRVTVRVAQCARGVEIAVTDTGVGIPHENMIRIFNHGFTTKKSGHGFGLHSGALAARELGGELRAHSGGPGAGATFVLELPVTPP
ncbi:MAG: PAS domain-containing protein [Sinobacteraceae bacterium]|nr:PAS domain-containing protein [Nevskiaceae bacterium]